MGKKTCGMSILSMMVANPLNGEKKPWKPWYGYLLVGVLLVSGGLYIYQRMHGGPVIPTFTDPATLYENAKAARERQEQAEEALVAPNTEETLSEVAKAALELLVVPLPASADVAVPFMTQAPSGVWDEAHVNASEEAALLMVQEFLAPSSPVDSVDALIAIGNERGLPSTCTSTEFAAFIEEYDAALNATVIEEPSIDEIKQFLANGTPVLVPVNGDLLQNPFYIAAGLPQHWIVLRGYEGEQFFVNDPGTRRGESYMYVQSVVMAAMQENRVVIVDRR
jgi:hypothetical protein